MSLPLCSAKQPILQQLKQTLKNAPQLFKDGESLSYISYPNPQWNVSTDLHLKNNWKTNKDYAQESWSHTLLSTFDWLFNWFVLSRLIPFLSQVVYWLLRIFLIFPGLFCGLSPKHKILDQPLHGSKASQVWAGCSLVINYKPYCVCHCSIGTCHFLSKEVERRIGAMV